MWELWIPHENSYVTIIQNVHAYNFHFGNSKTKSSSAIFLIKIMIMCGAHHGGKWIIIAEWSICERKSRSTIFYSVQIHHAQTICVASKNLPRTPNVIDLPLANLISKRFVDSLKRLIYMSFGPNKKFITFIWYDTKKDATCRAKSSAIYQSSLRCSHTDNKYRF